jgi:hypothetical protein
MHLIAIKIKLASQPYTKFTCTMTAWIHKLLDVEHEGVGSQEVLTCVPCGRWLADAPSLVACVVDVWQLVDTPPVALQVPFQILYRMK